MEMCVGSGSGTGFGIDARGDRPMHGFHAGGSVTDTGPVSQVIIPYRQVMGLSARFRRVESSGGFRGVYARGDCARRSGDAWLCENRTARVVNIDVYYTS